MKSATREWRPIISSRFLLSKKADDKVQSSLSSNQLNTNPSYQLARSHALCIYPSNAIYSYIPKNACSSLRLSVLIANGVLKDESKVSFIHSNNKLCAAEIRDLCTCKYSFAVIRDPASRLVSVFLDKFVKKTAFCVNYVKRFSSSSYDSFSFSDFVNSLTNGGRPALVFNGHWRPQIDFLIFENYTHLFKFEDLNNCVVTLKNQIDFQFYDARRLTRHGMDRYKQIELGDAHTLSLLKISELSRSGSMPSHACFIDEALSSKIESLYTDDYKLHRSLS